MRALAVRTLPIRLRPRPDESLDSWLFAYAVRLETPLTLFAAAAGLPSGFVRQPPRAVALGRGLVELDLLVEATGVDRECIERVAGSFTRYTKAVRDRFAKSGLLRGVVPTAWSRFCPACLAADGDRWKAAWRLAWHTTCESHGVFLVDTCGACGGNQRKRPFVADDVDPRLARCCRATVSGGRAGCGAGLISTAAPSDQSTAKRTLAFQAAVAPALAADAAPVARSDALDVLADVLVIAGRFDGTRFLDAHVLGKPAEVAPVLARAWDVYVGNAHHDIVSTVARETKTPGVLPREWAVASGSLVARAVSSRDESMRITDRLRWRSATAPRRPTATGLEVAKARARHIPEALWDDWTVRLAPRTGVDALSFRLVAAAALLVPGTPRPLGEVLRGTPHEGRGRKVFHVLAMIPSPDSALVLRALTELADGLDARDGAIDYQRRRELAASVSLLGDMQWDRICAAAGIPKGGNRKLRNARLWIHEALTGSPPHSAPAAIRPDEQGVIAYHQFALRLPARAAELLAVHARAILDGNGIDEPLTWSPPRDWVGIERLPGPEPDEIDLARLRRLLRSGLPARAMADSLGVSLEHLRLAVRRLSPDGEPRPVPVAKPRKWNRRPFPIQLTPERLRQLVVEDGRGMKSIAREFGADRKTIKAALVREDIPVPPSGGRPKFVVDPDWLRGEYVERRRTLPDIAGELGTSPTNLARIARKHDIPLRPRGGPSHGRSVALPDHALPFPLRAAIGGAGGAQRLRRYQVMARSPSIRQAAMTMGCNEFVVYSQLAQLEQACGGVLLTRYTRTHRHQTMTSLGRVLLGQADEHFGPAARGRLEGLPEPLACAVAGLRGEQRVRRFLTVARADSLRQAAEILGAHDATITLQVRSLEAACGGPLLHRRTSSRPQQLTDLGRLLVAQANAHPRAVNRNA